MLGQVLLRPPPLILAQAQAGPPFKPPGPLSSDSSPEVVRSRLRLGDKPICTIVSELMARQSPNEIIRYMNTLEASLSVGKLNSAEVDGMRRLATQKKLPPWASLMALRILKDRFALSANRRLKMRICDIAEQADLECLFYLLDLLVDLPARSRNVDKGLRAVLDHAFALATLSGSDESLEGRAYGIMRDKFNMSQIVKAYKRHQNPMLFRRKKVALSFTYDADTLLLRPTNRFVASFSFIVDRTTNRICDKKNGILPGPMWDYISRSAISVNDPRRPLPDPFERSFEIGKHL